MPTQKRLIGKMVLLVLVLFAFIQRSSGAADENPPVDAPCTDGAGDLFPEIRIIYRFGDVRTVVDAVDPHIFKEGDKFQLEFQAGMITTDPDLHF